MSEYPTWKDVEYAQKINKRREIIKFLSKFKKYFWWAFVPSSILGGVFQFALRDFVSITNANYILSSITQGLASLVALLFVIIFFLCQSTGRVSILSQVLKPDGYFLLGIFVISIIFPLFTMKIWYTNFFVNLSISMCVFCLLSLVPFIMAVNNITKKFGIRNIIADLGVLKFPADDNKYEILVNDLQAIGPEEIIKLEGDLVIGELIEELKRSIYSRTKFTNKSYSMAMLANIGVFSLIKEEGIKGYFNYVKQIIGERLYKDSCYIASKENLNVSLCGISELLSNLKLHGKSDEKVRLYFAEIQIKSLYEIFDNIKAKEEGNLVIAESEENRIDLEWSQKSLEEQIRTFIRRNLIYFEDYKKVYEELMDLLEDDRKEEFKKYIE